jgi:hypothetical protein
MPAAKMNGWRSVTSALAANVIQPNQEPSRNVIDSGRQRADVDTGKPSTGNADLPGVTAIDDCEPA